MLAIIVDPHFKSLQIVKIYVGHEDAIHRLFLSMVWKPMTSSLPKPYCPNMYM